MTSCEQGHRFYHMRKLISILAVVASATGLFAQKDPLVGFYVGTVENGIGYPFKHSPDLCIEVARFGDKYQAKLTEKPLARADTYGFVEGLVAVDGKLSFKDFGERLKLSGELTAEGGVLKSKDRKGKDVIATFKKTVIVSPTMGLQAPPNAIVLFDGTNTDEWEHTGGTPCCWEIKDGAMISRPQMVNGKRRDGTIFTKKKFGAMRVHLEFKIPAEYDKPNSRGNSGVHFGPYEVQIIDSFGSEGNWWQCGSIYRIHAPKVNASLEPEVWQTYDIEYTPAKFMNGKLVAHPELTVYQNGIRIQYKEPVFHKTNVQFKTEPHELGLIPFGLQDHAHPVAFRNIWVVAE